MSESVYEAAEKLTESLAVRLTGGCLRRLEVKKAHGGKLILPDAFAELTDPGRPYRTWPGVEGKLRGYSVWIEFLPRGGDDRCLSIMELRGPMPLDFVISGRNIGRSGSEQAARSTGVDFNAAYPLSGHIVFSSGSEGCWKFFESEAARKIIASLQPFDRLVFHSRYMRMSFETESCGLLAEERIMKVLDSLCTLADDVRSFCSASAK